MENQVIKIFCLSAFTLATGHGLAQPRTAAVAATAEQICPLLPGMQAPDVEFSSTEGLSLPLTTILEKGPAVLIFYRGGW